MGNPNSSAQVNYYLRSRLPAHLRDTFTEEQLTAIRETYSGLSRGSTPIIDQRVTLPIPGSPLYAVLIVGRDLRSKSRAEKTRTTVKRAIKARLIMAACVVLGCGSMLGLVKLRHVYSTQAYRSTLRTEDATAHPTTVPFKRDRTACETSGREWRNDECVDHEHNPTF